MLIPLDPTDLSPQRRQRTSLSLRAGASALTSVVILWSVVFAPPSQADSPLHVRIDRILTEAQKKSGAIASKNAGDAEFLRRVYLDLAGRIPTAGEARRFLHAAANSPAGRGRLIDDLLARPEHARRLQQVFDVIFMERRAGTNVNADEWRRFLFRAFWRNRAWDDLTRDILAADGVRSRERPAARFYLDRNLDLDLLTRDIGRVFLGVDLECAQCHDHPSVSNYLQRHYYGLNAFLKRTYLFTDPKTKKKVLGEKAVGDVSFTSVFTQQSGKTHPRLLDLPEIPDPRGTRAEYVVAPKKNARGVPRYSRREQLSKAMLSPANSAFRKNIVNRLWALMFGKGLVEPLDFWHAENPPSHPKLIELLADEFARHDYDIRWLLREMALTRAYQRSSVSAESSVASGKHFEVALLKPLSAEQLAWSVMQATGVTERLLAQQERKLLVKEPPYRPSRRGLPIWQNRIVSQAAAPHVATFVSTFARQAGQRTDFDAAAHQALFLINGPLVAGWLRPASYDRLLPHSRRKTYKRDNLTARLVKLKDEATFADELYICVLSRPPSSLEKREVAEYLGRVKNRSTAAQELVWALLSSAEFRFNH